MTLGERILVAYWITVSLAFIAFLILIAVTA